MAEAARSVLLVDDRCAIRHGLRMRLQLEADLRVIGEAANAGEGAVLARALDADVVVLSTPDLEDLSTTRSLVDAAPRSLVFVLTPRETLATGMAVRATGIVGLVSMQDGPDALIGAIRGR
jgi:DNA-binding NarL/FixJ family response regulator